jgi:hypothetical protein
MGSVGKVFNTGQHHYAALGLEEVGRVSLSANEMNLM